MMRKTLIAVGTAAAALLVGAGTATAASTTPSPSASTSTSSSSTTQLERVSAYTQPSVAYIGIDWTGYVYDKFNKIYLNKGKPFHLSFQCTGYVVNPDGYIATAGHCVNPDEVKAEFIKQAAQWALNTGYYASKTLTLEDILGFDDYVVMNADKKKTPDRTVTAAWGVSAGGVQTGKALPARVIKFQNFDDGDAALLKVEATNLNALPLSDATPDIGMEIVSIGYPANVDLVADQSFDPSYKEGSISSKKTVSHGLSTVYEISAAVSGGMSGGPTVNTDSQVVGFNSFGINSQIETQQFNFVRPVENIKELIGDAGTTNTLSQDTQNYRAGLDAYFNGDRTTAVKKLSAVVQSQPTFQFASDYLEKSKKLPLPPKKDTGSSAGKIVGIVIGLVVLLLLAGLVLFLLTRNRRKQQQPPAAQVPAYAGAPGPGYPTAPGSYQGAPNGYAAPSPNGGGYSAPQPVAQPVTQPVPQSAPPSAPSAPSAAPQAAPAAPQASASAAGATAAAPVPADSTDSGDLFCPNCGQKHAPGQKFCPHCGAHL
jgi:S1-C subfamily serine protease